MKRHIDLATLGRVEARGGGAALGHIRRAESEGKTRRQRLKNMFQPLNRSAGLSRALALSLSPAATGSAEDSDRLGGEQIGREVPEPALMWCETQRAIASHES